MVIKSMSNIPDNRRTQYAGNGKTKFVIPPFRISTRTRKLTLLCRVIVIALFAFFSAITTVLGADSFVLFRISTRITYVNPNQIPTKLHFAPLHLLPMCIILFGNFWFPWSVNQKDDTFRLCKIRHVCSKYFVPVYMFGRKLAKLGEKKQSSKPSTKQTHLRALFLLTKCINVI